MLPLRRAFAFAVLVACATAQVDQGARIAAALARGDLATARAIAAAEPSLARRALLEAALAARADRPAAMLAVALRFADDPVAATALRTGLAAAAAELGCAEAAGEAFADFDADEERAAPWREATGPTLDAVLPQLLALQRRRDDAAADDADAVALRRLARACSAALAGDEPLPLPADEAWPLPKGLLEDVVVAVRPLGDAVPDLPGVVAALEREPATRWWIAAANAPRELRCPPPGRWLVEVQSLQSPWRALRLVDVGALQATVLVDAGVAAFAVDGDDEPAPSWSLWHGARREPMTATGTVGVCPLGDAPRGTRTVQVRQGDRRGRVAVWLPEREAFARQQHVVHWHVDRPLHRPGETVRGRAVVRRVVWSGDDDLDAVPSTAPLANATLTLRGRFPGEPPFAIDASTDGRGVAVFDVAVPDGAEPGTVTAELGAADAAIARTTLTRVAAFRRPMVLAELNGPARAPAADGVVAVTLRVRWASGGPAANVPVDVTVWSSGRGAERRALATGPDGALVVPVALDDERAGGVTCRCEVRGPDGHVETLQHVVVVDAPASATRAAVADEPREHRPLSIDAPAFAVVGTAAPVVVRGTPNTEVLAVVGRGTTARASRLWLNRDGIGTWPVDVTPRDWPRLDLTVAALDGDDVARAHAGTRQRAPAPLTLDVPATTRPGERVVATVRTAPGSVVTVAVVDERVFRLEPDPTRGPDDALRPDVPWPQWRLHRSAELADPRLVLGELFVAGRVASPFAGSGGGPGAAGGAAGGPSGPGAAAPERADFRATACFHVAVADADGVARVACELPDDVTTWRVTASSVDERGEGRLATARLDARLPLAAEPMLPRVLRRGDRVTVPLVLDRAGAAAGTDGDTDVAFAVRAAEPLHVAAGGEGRRVLAAGHAAIVPFELEARGVGPARLELEAGRGGTGDRSRRTLLVLPDVVTALAAASASGHGTVELALPAGDPGAPRRVHVLAGGHAALTVLAERLEQYPYGCVEQTLSRLLPFAVAGAMPVADEAAARARAARVAAGCARLRALQQAPGGAFAWWPGDRADLAMTGLVLHGLAALRAGGLDPAAHRLTANVDALLPLARAAGGTVGAELAAGLLRVVPGDAAVRAFVAEFVDARHAVPRGACVRLGLALAAAGDVDRAQRCRDGLPLAPAAAGFPGEHALVVAAQQLELQRALAGAADPDAERALLQALLGGAGHTYANGAALVALAPALRAAAAGFAVAIAVDGGAATTLRARPEDGGHVQLDVGAGVRCTVRCAEPDLLLFVHATAEHTRPAAGGGWAAPFAVERELLVRRGRGWEPAGERVVAGEALRVRVTVGSATDAAYVAVVCPLPAGVEVLGAPERLQVLDDRAVATVARLRGGVSARVELDVVATLPGRVLWPPVVAETMYGAEQGASNGAVLTIDAAPPAAAAESVAPFLRRPAPRARAVAVVAPPAPPTAAERADAAWRELAAVWSEGLFAGIHGLDEEPDAEAHARIGAAFTVLESLLDEDGGAVADAVGQQLVDAGRQRGGALAPWRTAVLARLDALRERCLELLVARVEREVADGEPVYVATWLLQRLSAERREAAVARLLAHAHGRSDDVATLVDVLEEPLRDERLAGVLAAWLPVLDGDALATLVRVLPQRLLAALPAAVLADRLPHADHATAAALADALLRHRSGLEELLRRAADPEFLAALSADALPDDLLAALPWTAYADVARDDEPRAVRLLANGTTPDAALWRLVREPDEQLPLAVVYSALRRRGAVPPPEALAAGVEPRARAVAAALHALRDPAAVPVALAAIRALPSGDGGDGALAPLLGELVARHGSAADVTARAAWLEPTHWPPCWERLEPAAMRDVLAAGSALSFPASWGAPAAVAFASPRTPAMAALLLEHAAAHHDEAVAVRALARTPGGEALLRELAPSLAGEVAAEARAVLDALALGPADSHERAARVAWVAELRGWDGAWPAWLEPDRDAVLRWRGLR
jgi:hypothetical protein